MYTENTHLYGSSGKNLVGQSIRCADITERFTPVIVCDSVYRIDTGFPKTIPARILQRFRKLVSFRHCRGFMAITVWTLKAHARSGWDTCTGKRRDARLKRNLNEFIGLFTNTGVKLRSIRNQYHSKFLREFTGVYRIKSVALFECIRQEKNICVDRKRLQKRPSYRTPRSF